MLANSCDFGLTEVLWFTVLNKLFLHASHVENLKFRLNFKFCQISVSCTIVCASWMKAWSFTDMIAKVAPISSCIFSKNFVIDLGSCHYLLLLFSSLSDSFKPKALTSQFNFFVLCLRPWTFFSLDVSRCWQNKIRDFSSFCKIFLTNYIVFFFKSCREFFVVIAPLIRISDPSLILIYAR